MNKNNKIESREDKKESKSSKPFSWKHVLKRSEELAYNRIIIHNRSCQATLVNYSSDPLVIFMLVVAPDYEDSS